MKLQLGLPDGREMLVLGKVNRPGLHELPRYQNDVGHALAAAEGLAEDAADVIEVHRRGQPCFPILESIDRLPPPAGAERSVCVWGSPGRWGRPGAGSTA